MKKIVTYYAEDNKTFGTEKERREYEKKLRKVKMMKIQKAMCDLDGRIWKKYYPDEDTKISQPELHTACIWLRNDIVHILTDGDIGRSKAREDILAIIKAEEYGEEILKYIRMDNILEEVKIRTDYLSAFQKVECGSDLAGDIGYCLGKKDLYQLAKLHKSNKYRKKIEDLLTACNFHHECGKFVNKEYEGFLCK